MNLREFQEKLPRYQNGGMSAEEAAAFEKALQTWEEELRDSGLEQTLRRRRRPDPPPALLHAYHQALQAKFPPPRTVPTPAGIIGTVWDFLFARRGAGVRLAEALVILVMGIWIGRSFFMPAEHRPQTAEPVPVAPQFYLRGITQEELQKMDAFFVDSEMLLLQIANLSTAEDVVADEVAMIRKMARRLLPKTALMKEKSVRYNDLQMLHFLSRLEILLYEIANTDPDEMVESLAFIQEMFRETGIIQEARMLQEIYRSDAVPTAAL